MNKADKLIMEIDGTFTSLHGIQLYIPDAEAVRKWHEQELVQNPAARFPFWAKLWPSSIAMTEYIMENSSLIAGKTVLEVAGGLGLPSLVAASYAREVFFTDLEPAAVLLFSKLMAFNQVTNVEAFPFDWNSPLDIDANVLLLSDVNYDDNAFDPLLDLIYMFLNKRSVVVLTTPMRLVGRKFIFELLPYIIDQQVKTIQFSGADTMITVLVLYRGDSI